MITYDEEFDKDEYYAIHALLRRTPAEYVSMRAILENGDFVDTGAAPWRLLKAPRLIAHNTEPQGSVNQSQEVHDENPQE